MAQACAESESVNLGRFMDQLVNVRALRTGARKCHIRVRMVS